ncbi:septum formation initiator family protein [Anaerococcus sp. WCA-380-WT-2B]|uniref:Septum formation initiator family protein n=1 Tax=Anaerococcus porci TaxID=2652269 RepID=A0A6N7VCT6_9FIRM|nr:septum formation initiator family protein [Anaerococcus porci]MSS77225.1 septum formation initiator family protein [Anaerococcus porci]
MNKYERYIKNRRKKNTRFLLFVILIFFIVFFISRSYNQSLQRKSSDLTEQIKTTDKNIKSVKNDIENIKKDYENRNTDTFKEKIAREKLGMVKKDEYVYKDNNK